MSRGDIDQRIVEMQFKNDQFERGIKQSNKSLEELKKGLQLDDAAASLSNLERAGRNFSMDGITTAVEAVSGKFSALEVVAISALNRITNQAMAAGERLVKSLSVDQITTGFDKYTEKTKSVNTIMNATGESIEFVEERMNKLNWFTDETSYNFTDMVNNIGKFTSAGVDLDTATNAMMGIALEAALAGQGVNEASRAMYNFAQAVGTGVVQLMDWRSIENANMGTKEFKETIIDSAVALGKLKRDSKGVVKTLKGTVVNFQKFNDTLSEKWFTKDVLLDALGKYTKYANQIYDVYKETGEPAAEIMDRIGKNMNDLAVRALLAGQVARTFKDSIDATKDAVSSGWMKSFELIFGDVNESAELWTDVTNALWEVFASGAENRNAILEEWKEAGGRTDLLDGLYSSFEALWNIINAVRDALAEVFPPITADRIGQWTTAVKEFGNGLKETFGLEEKVVGQQEKIIKETVPNYTEAFDEALEKGSRGEGVRKLQERLMALSYSVGDTGADAIFGPKTEQGLKDFQKAMGLAITGIYDEATHKSLINAIFGTKEIETSAGIEDIIEEQYSPALEKIHTLAEGFFSAIGLITDSIKLIADTIAYVGDMMSPIGSAIFDVVLMIAQCFTGLRNSTEEAGTFETAFETIKAVLEPLRGIFNTVAEAIRNFFGVGEGITDFGSLWDQIVSSLGSTYEKVRSYVEGILEFFGKLFGINNKGGKHGPNIKDSNVLNKNGMLFEIYDENMLDHDSNILDRLRSLFSNIGDLRNIWEAVKQFFKGIGETVKTFNIGEKLNSVWTSVSKFFIDAFELAKSWHLGEKLLSAWNTISEFVSNARTTISSWNLGGKVVSIWETIRTFLFGSSDEEGSSTGFIGKVFSWFAGVVNIFKSIWERTQKIVTESGVLERIRNAFNKIRESFAEVWPDIQEAMSSLRASIFGENGVTGEGLSVGEWLIHSIPNWINSILTALAFILEKLRPLISKIPKMIERIKQIYEYIKKKIIDLLTALGITGTASKKKAAKIGGSRLDRPSKKGQTEKDPWYQPFLTFIERLANFFNALKPWLPLLAIGAGVIAVVVGVTKLIKPITNLIKAYTEAKYGYKKISEKESFGTSLLKIASSIALVAAAMYMLGSLDDAAFTKGVTTVSGIALALTILSVGLSKLPVGGANSLSSASVGLLEIAGAIGIIAAAIIAFGYLSDDGKIIKGAGALVGIMALLGAFIVALNKLNATKINLKGLLELSAAIGILGIIAWLLGQIDTSQLWSGIGAVAALSIIIGGVVTIISRVGKAKNFKISGLIGLSVAVGLLGIIAGSLGKLDSSQLWSGVIAVTVLTALVAGSVILMSRIGELQSFQITGLIGLSVAVGILGVVAANLGKLDSGQLWSGIGAVAALGLIVTGLGSVFNKVKGMSFNYGGLIAILLGLITVMAVFTLAMNYMKDISPGQMLGFAGSVAILLASITAVSIAASKMGDVKSMVTGAAGVAAAFAIIAVLGTALVAGLGKIDFMMDGKLIADIQNGGKVLEELADALNVFDDPLKSGLAAAGLFAAIEIAGIDPLATVAGAASLGAAFAVIAAVTTAVVAGLGSLDEYLNGDVVSSIEQGGDVLSSLANALDIFDDPFKSAAAAAGLFAITEIAGLNPLGTILGATALGGAFTAIVSIVTATVGGIGKLDKAWNGQVEADIIHGGEILSALGGALASFGTGFKDEVNKSYKNYADTMDEVAGTLEKYNAVDENGNSALDNAVENANAIAKKIDAFYKDLEPYDFTEHPEIAGYETAASQLSTDMGKFAEAVGSLAENLSGMSEITTLEADTEAAVSRAKEIYNFFQNLKPYEVFPGGLDGTYFTAPGQLSADIDSFSRAIGSFSKKVGGMTNKYPDLEADTGEAITIASQVKRFFDEVGEQANAIGQDNLQLYNDAVTGLFGKMDEMSTTISDFAGKVQGISQSTLKVDTDEAISVMTKIQTFLTDAATIEIELPSEGIWSIFKDKTNFETIIDATTSVGESINSLRTNIAGIGGDESTFDADSGVALSAMRSMAYFMQEIGGLNIPQTPSWFKNFFTGESNPVDIVFTKLNEMGRSGMWNDIQSNLAGLSGNTFQANFDAAMNAMTSLADFMVSVNTFDKYGNAVINEGALFRSSEVISTLSNLADKLTEFAGIGDKDLSAIATISEAYATAQEAISKIGKDAGGNLTISLKSNANLSSALADILSTAVANANTDQFSTVGTNIVVGLANGINASAGWAYSAITSLMNNLISYAEFTVRIGSPSKVFANIGKFIDLGLEGGINTYADTAVNATHDMVQRVVDEASTMASAIGLAVSEGVSASPRVSPILDLDSMASRIDPYISDLYSAKLAMESASYGSSRYNERENMYDKMRDIQRESTAALREEFARLQAVTEQLAHQQIVLDTGVVVGGIGPGMDQYLGRQQILAGRRLG